MPTSRSTPTGQMVRGGSALADVLHAEGPDPERALGLALYSWLVGRWEMDVTTILEDGSTHRGLGEPG